MMRGQMSALRWMGWLLVLRSSLGASDLALAQVLDLGSALALDLGSVQVLDLGSVPALDWVSDSELAQAWGLGSALWGSRSVGRE